MVTIEAQPGGSRGAQKASETHYFNPDEVAAALKATPAQIVPVGVAQSRWSVGSASFGELTLWWGYQAAKSCALGAVPQGTAVIGVGSREHCIINGREYSSRVSAFMPAGADYLCAFSRPDAFCFVSAPDDWLLAKADDELRDRMLRHGVTTFHLGEHGEGARSALSAARDFALRRPERFARAHEREAVRDSLLASLFAALDPSEAVADANDPRLERRLIEYLREQGGEPLYQEQLCIALGTSRRSLRRVFPRLFGCPPATYLRMRRMHLARRALLQGHCDSITEAAVRFGFYDLGRFAGTYKLIYGELPSESLRLSPRAWRRGTQRRR